MTDDFQRAWVDSYAADCKRIVTEFVESSTRYGAADLAIGKSRPTLEHVHIRVMHVLDVQSEFETVCGRAPPGSSDVAIADLDAFRRAVAEQEDEDQNNDRVIHAVAARASREPYAAIELRTCIRTHSRRFFHTYRCKPCDGAGETRCKACDGNGWTQCFACDGYGNASCPFCSGKGQRVVTRWDGQMQPGQPVSRQVTEKCSCYNGTVPCGCDRGRLHCGTCKSSGRITCTTCQGQGCLTSIATTRTYDTPSFGDSYPPQTSDYVRVTLAKAGLTRLQQYGPFQFASCDVLSNASLECGFDGAIAFCETPLVIKGHPSHWILFGTPAHVADAGGALELLLQADLDEVGGLQASAERWRPGFPARAGRVLRPFMESELNQQLLQEDSGARTPALIAETLKGAVSEAYVARVMALMKQVVTTSLRWTQIYLGLLVVGLSFAAYLLLTRARVTPTSASLAILGVPIALVCFALVNLTYRMWLKRAGGAALQEWAVRRGLVARRPTGAAFVALGVISIVGVHLFSVPARPSPSFTVAPPAPMAVRQPAVTPRRSRAVPVVAVRGAGDSVASVVPVADVVQSGGPWTLDGHWYSPVNRYSMRISGMRGIVTLSNSENYGIGDLGLRIDSVDGDSLKASAVFTNGVFFECVGRLHGDTLSMFAPVANHRWYFVRTPMPASVTISDALPASAIPAPDFPDQPAVSFDGEWYSSSNRYGVRIAGLRGIAIAPLNGRIYRIGDVTLRIDTIVGNAFSGSNLFLDGGFYPVTGRLIGADSIDLRSPRLNSHWGLRRQR